MRMLKSYIKWSYMFCQTRPIVNKDFYFLSLKIKGVFFGVKVITVLHRVILSLFCSLVSFKGAVPSTSSFNRIWYFRMMTEMIPTASIWANFCPRQLCNNVIKLKSMRTRYPYDLGPALNPMKASRGHLYEPSVESINLSGLKAAGSGPQCRGL